MECEVEDSATASLWPSILEFWRFLKTPPAFDTQSVFFFRHQGVWRLAVQNSPALREASQLLAVPLRSPEPERLAEKTRELGGSATLFSPTRYARGECPFVRLKGELDAQTEKAFRLYLPILLGGHQARAEGRLFVTAHLAQTLGGRIACLNSHSQWISNQANLDHAHRLRALHDAVIVGGRTVEADDPLLTVRHVDGEDPTRIILDGSASCLRSGKAYQVFDGPGCKLLCRRSALAGSDVDSRAERQDEVEIVPVDCPKEASIPPSAVAQVLNERGMHSAFLEGGGLAVSGFLHHRAIDILHVHVAPVIIGSGIQSFTLPEVASIQEGRRFHMEHFTSEGGLLLECREIGRPTAAEES